MVYGTTDYMGRKFLSKFDCFKRTYLLYGSEEIPFDVVLDLWEGYTNYHVLEQEAFKLGIIYDVFNNERELQTTYSLSGFQRYKISEKVLDV